MDLATTIQTAALAGSHAAHDLSVWSLFIQADLIVKVILLILISASIWSWAIIVDKWMTFKSLDIKANKFETAFWSGEALEKIYKRIQIKATDPMARTFCAGMNEWNLTIE